MTVVSHQTTLKRISKPLLTSKVSRYDKEVRNYGEIMIWILTHSQKHLKTIKRTRQPHVINQGIWEPN